jgi:hypothetical protein
MPCCQTARNDWRTSVIDFGNRIHIIARFDSSDWKGIQRFIPRALGFTIGQSHKVKAI